MLPPPLETVQVTAVFVLPFTVAVKFLVAPWFTVALVGLMVTVTVAACSAAKDPIARHGRRGRGNRMSRLKGEKVDRAAEKRKLDL